MPVLCFNYKMENDQKISEANSEDAVAVAIVVVVSVAVSVSVAFDVDADDDVDVDVVAVVAILQFCIWNKNSSQILKSKRKIKLWRHGFSF